MAGIPKRSSPAPAATVVAGLPKRSASTSESEIERVARALSAPSPLPSQAAPIAGQIIEVPISRVRPNPENPRAFRTSSAIDEMSESLKKNGQLVPCAAYTDGDDYVLIDGGTRYEGLKSAGIGTMRLELHSAPASKRELLLLSSRINRDRQNESPLDLAVTWRSALKRGLFTSQQDLAEANSVAESDVSKILGIAELPHKVLTTLADYPERHSVRFLYAIKQYWEVYAKKEASESAPGFEAEAARNAEAHVQQFVIEAAGQGYSSLEVDSRRKRLESAPKQKPRSEKTAFEFAGVKGEVARFDTKGKLILSISGLKPEECASLERMLLDVVSREPQLPMG